MSKEQTLKAAPRRRKLGDDLIIISSYARRSDAPERELSAVELMTVVLEDRRFFQHNGLDLQSVLREAWRLICFRRVGGASTIDMQFVRTVTGYRDRTLARKLREVALAMMLQRHSTKRAILRAYLSMAYFGTGLTGVTEAARKMFSKTVAELSLEEAALLAAMLCHPRPRAAPASWREKAERRAAYSLRLYRTQKVRLSHNGTVPESKI